MVVARHIINDVLVRARYAYAPRTNKKQGHHEVASLLEKVEAMKDVFPLAKNTLLFYSCINDAENLQKVIANQSDKKASDNFCFQSTAVC